MESKKPLASALYEFTPPDIIGDVSSFFFTAQPEMIGRPNAVPNKKTLELAYKLIDEEVNKELLPMLQKIIDGAYSQELMVEVLDGYVDTIYVAAWGCIALNLPFNPAWHIVHENNISKFPLHEGCDAPFCDMEKNPLKEEIEYEGKQINVTTVCRMGRLLCTNDVTGKVIKPKGFKKVALWDVVHKVWGDYAKANPPKPMTPPDINAGTKEEFPEL